MASTVAWDWYRSFLGVMKEGSLSAAARALGLTQPTVGRHIAALEQSLAAPLFIRSPAGLLPTEAAQALLAHVEAMESSASALERAVSSRSAGVRGVVRIAASEIVAVEVLPPVIADLRRVHPELVIELVASNRLQDLLRRDADIAVRMVRPRQESLIARRIGQVVVGLHAHPRYLAEHGTPRKPEDLKEHALIGFDEESAFIRSVLDFAPGIRRSSFSMRTDNDLAQLALLRAGAGIGFCQVPIARRDGLQRLMPRQFSLSLETWVAMHEDLRTSLQCKATFDALVQGMLRHVEQQ